VKLSDSVAPPLGRGERSGAVSTVASGDRRCDARTVASKIFPMLSCGDLGRSLAFYGDLLGGVETYRFPDEGEPAFVALRIGESSEIGLGGMAAEPVHGRAQRPASGHRIELCVYVDDVDAVFARAHARHFEQVADPADMPWGERAAWIADPDGNLVMLTR
jgi:lactoylglutathione lyase